MLEINKQMNFLSTKNLQENQTNIAVIHNIDKNLYLISI